MRIEASIDHSRAQQARSFVEKRLGKPYSQLSVQEKIQAIYNLQRGCRCCELCQSQYRPVPSIIRPGSKYVFIGRAPNESESMESKLFPKTTRQGKCLEAYLRTLGIGEGECSFLNCCQCGVFNGYGLTSDHVSICSFYKELELELIGDQFEHVFLLGDTPIKWMFGPFAAGLQKINGVSLKATLWGKERFIHTIFHPSYLVIKPELKREIGFALESVRQLLNPTTKEKKDD